MGNGVDELRNKAIEVFGIITAGEAITFESAGDERVVDFSLAACGISANQIKVGLPEAVDSGVSAAVKSLRRFFGKNDLVGRVKTGEPAEVEVEARGHVLIAPAARTQFGPGSSLHHSRGRHIRQSAVSDH